MVERLLGVTPKNADAADALAIAIAAGHQAPIDIAAATNRTGVAPAARVGSTGKDTLNRVFLRRLKELLPGMQKRITNDRAAPRYNCRTGRERRHSRCGGVGYAITVSGKTQARLGLADPAVTLLTEMIVREDSMTLFGFLSRPNAMLLDC